MGRLKAAGIVVSPGFVLLMMRSNPLRIPFQ